MSQSFLKGLSFDASVKFQTYVLHLVRLYQGRVKKDENKLTLLLFSCSK